MHCFSIELYRGSFGAASCDFVDRTLAPSRRSIKSHKHENAAVSWGIQDERLLSKVVLASATLCTASGVKCSARRASEVHRAREEVRDGIATAENRDSYADI